MKESSTPAQVRLNRISPAYWRVILDNRHSTSWGRSLFWSSETL